MNTFGCSKSIYPMNEYNFILDASSFEKGLGNIKRWCEECPDKVKLRLYIPTYTLNELDFLRFRRKSYIAKESLKFIDAVSNGDSTANPEFIIEFPEILELVTWSEVLEHVSENSQRDVLNKLPKRFKLLIKSCLFKCQFDDGSDGLKWIFITEDLQICDLATICNIPCCSIVDADSILNKDMNTSAYKENEKFNDLVAKSGIRQKTTVKGKKVVTTQFGNTVYAPRGSGELWRP